MLLSGLGRWVVGAGVLGLATLALPARAQEVLYDEPSDAPVTHFEEEPAAEPPAGEPSTAPPPPPEPSAGTPEADAEARALFEQGRIAFEEGRYRDSWDYFHRAYTLSKRPKLLYNVGQAADRLRMDREALKAFRLYLKHVPEAENRQEVEARVRALEARLGPEGEEGALPPEGEEGAEDEAELSEEEQAAAEAEQAHAKGQPTRAGWYMRLAGGIGLMLNKVSATANDGTLSSLTASGELGIGYPVIEKLVVGGMVLFDIGLAPKFEGVDVDSASVAGIGAFVDYYVDPRADGWHLGGGLALTQLAKEQRTPGAAGATVSTDPASGLALVLGGGYEWGVGQDWAIGPVGRLTLARLSESDYDHTLFVVSAMFGATWF